MWRGGNFLTQAATTNSHSFWRRKILAAGESIEEFREVSPASKSNIEREDALRAGLSGESIVSLWKRATIRYTFNTNCIGSFDEETQTGSLNGITGLSLAEMADILLAGNPRNGAYERHFAYNAAIRTNLWQMWYMDGTISAGRVFYKCTNLEVACASYLRVDTDTFSGCKKLHTIIGPLYDPNSNNPSPFKGCAALVSLPGFGWKGTLTIADSPLLSTASVKAFITAAKAGEATGLTLHPEAYARVADEIFAAAAEKQITISTTS